MEVPMSTVPMSTVPMSTVPMSTVPMSTVPMEVRTMETITYSQMLAERKAHTENVKKLADRILWRLDILAMADDDDASVRLVMRGLLVDIATIRKADGVRSPNLFRMVTDCVRFAEYERALHYWRASVYGF